MYRIHATAHSTLCLLSCLHVPLTHAHNRHSQVKVTLRRRPSALPQIPSQTVALATTPPLALIACLSPVASLVASTSSCQSLAGMNKTSSKFVIVTLFPDVSVEGVSHTHAVHHKVVTPTCHVGEVKGSLQQWHVVLSVQLDTQHQSGLSNSKSI